MAHKVSFYHLITGAHNLYELFNTLLITHMQTLIMTFGSIYSTCLLLLVAYAYDSSKHSFTLPILRSSTVHPRLFFLQTN